MFCVSSPVEPGWCYRAEGKVNVEEEKEEKTEVVQHWLKFQALVCWFGCVCWAACCCFVFFFPPFLSSSSSASGETMTELSVGVFVLDLCSSFFFLYIYTLLFQASTISNHLTKHLSCHFLFVAELTRRNRRRMRRTKIKRKFNCEHKG